MKKPRDITTFKRWAAKEIDSNFADSALQSLYETNVANIQLAVVQHPFFKDFAQEAAAWEKSYQNTTSSRLFMNSHEPDLIVKPYPSAVEKCYRRNILLNRNFPKAPEGGWVDKHNLYAKLNDLVRGTLVCRFLDGPDYIVQRMSKYATAKKLKSRSYSQERDDGYYAFHFYISFPVKIFDFKWSTVDIATEVEIQITTQLQEVLRAVTHPLYESQRLLDDNSSKWKWDFKSARFKVGYLSHTLHLLESVILESRDHVLKGGSKSLPKGGKNG